MINEKSIEAVEKAKFSKNFCKPLYENYCFSNIPKTIERLLCPNIEGGLPSDTIDTSKEYDHVVLLFLDAFGWRFFEEYAPQIPFLNELKEKGITSKITSMFPSTTAAHVTCINTGLTPAESGIYEWFMLEPSLNAIIAPLPFQYAGERKAESLLNEGLKPETIFPKETIYKRLKANGVNSYCLEPKDITDSSYSKIVLNGAEVIGYKKPSEAFEAILKNLKPKTYCYFYYGEIDAVGHRKDVNSKEFSKTVHQIFAEIETFYRKLPKKTALILTADHGMTSIHPKTTYYLNKKIPNIAKDLQFGYRNKPLAPAGSCRDLFLHVHEENLLELKDVLSHFLDGKAEIYLTKELIDQGFFGPKPPTEKFLSRVGNLTILSYENEAIWWFEKGRFQQNFYAAHGGLTRNEMETVFLFHGI